MKRHITYLLLLFVAAALSGCERGFEDDEVNRTEELQQGLYGQLGIAKEYNVSLTGVTRSTTQELGSSLNGDFHSSLSCQEWTDQKPLSTRTSWNDGISWGGEQTSFVGIFTMLHRDDSELTGLMTDAQMLALMEQDKLYDTEGNVIGMNRKCTAYTESTSYKYLRYVTSATSGSDFNQNLRFDPSSGECEGVDFYAYYPYNESSRDLSSVGGFSLTNQANSIALIQDDQVASNLTNLKFNIKVLQTDDNMWYHDLMYSVRESANEYNKYGNVGKKNSGSLASEATSHCDNVHLRMKHALCRLHIKIAVNDIFLASHVDASGKVFPDYIYLDGSRVYHSGHLNLVTGGVTPDSGSSDTNRLLDETNSDHYFSADSPNIEFDMLFIPALIDDREQFVFYFEVDGNVYSLDLFDCRSAGESTLQFSSGHVYNLNMEMSTNTSVIVDQTYGGHTICTQKNPCLTSVTESDYGEWTSNHENIEYYATSYKYIIVYPQQGWRFGRISYNGSDISERSVADNPFYVGTVMHDGMECPVYRLVEKDNSKVTYSVRFIPEQWYSSPENVLLHFDGYYNTGFSAEKRTKADKYWHDLTGSNSLMSLAVMSSTDVVNDYSQVASPDNYLSTISQSGWTYGGFKCNGNTDYLAIEPVFNCEEFTIEFYMCIEAAQVAFYPRILGEADPGYMFEQNGTTINTKGIPSLVMYTESGTSLLKPSYTLARSAHVMGLGLNSANETGTGQKVEIELPTDGKTLIHVVLRYKGGNGGFGADGLPRSHKDNLMSLSLEYDLDGALRSRMVYFTGNEAKVTELLGDELSSKWGKVQYYIAKWSLDSALDMLKQAVAGTISAPYTINADDYASSPIVADNKPALVSYAQMHYLEDPYMPELWAVLGGRPNDFSRNLNATYCSFMVYDKFLTYDEIKYNYERHKERFGTVKPDLATNSQ